MDQNLSKEAKEQLAELRQWVESQPHFPKNIGKRKTTTRARPRPARSAELAMPAEASFHFSPELY